MIYYNGRGLTFRFIVCCVDKFISIHRHTRTTTNTCMYVCDTFNAFAHLRYASFQLTKLLVILRFTFFFPHSFFCALQTKFTENEMPRRMFPSIQNKLVQYEFCDSTSTCLHCKQCICRSCGMYVKFGKADPRVTPCDTK